MIAIPEDSKEIQMRIPTHLENVFLVGLAVRGLCSATALTEIEIYEVEAAVVEAVNNVVKHAYQCRPDRDVDVRVALSPEQIMIQVSDQGDSMKTMKACELNYDIHDRKRLPEGGMGLPIIQHNMDEVVYDTLSGTNVLTMKKYIKAG